MGTTTEAEIHHQHRDVGGGWLRPTVFGAMDGLVSNFALVAGVAAASSSGTQVTLAGWAGLVGGAFSMAAGEFISVRSQNESTAAEVEVERRELLTNAAAEQAELAQAFVAKGVDADIAAIVAAQLSRDPDQALLVHAREELGVDPKQLPSPAVAAASSLASFALGAFVPLLPYLLGATTIVVPAVLAVVALFAAGAVTSRFTSRSWWFAGARQLAFGLAAAAVTYGVGAAFGATVG
ncbi:Predicted Fe2+/Mn2+ transporter, VIT1/CCC1 family [Jatrophihabitans endophyticus]|uniref:Predicted Fe2+/Mn2+ transporter, VIT1/CCC1 family n=1 Tax=Jatrophihabitans endophyticus TaxID=1206085 RepID=A0A1M5LGK2_9ACTN|nr:VIT1/CCC1 transporter family protein [Jatrophihabitans endophyticus]SHG64095.1 Predicted Fe2+/Mn2+ transporter, VIT1/CCC1 family [Jatrophihabitans endophyticus]